VTSQATVRQQDPVLRVQSIASEIAAPHAEDVDRGARFPHEVFSALRDEELLSALVPVELGGAGASMRELAEMCCALASGCGSSGMILAMHHIQVACIARHGRSEPAFEAYLREIAERQLLLASITSEVGTGGDTRASICAVERVGDRVRIDKQATTVSYGEPADDLLVTCRRAADSPPGDQVLVLARDGEYALERTGEWDTLGMRGTCSPPFRFRLDGPATRVLSTSFAIISARSMVPYSHVLWSAVWLGIASDAVARAAAYVRGEARKKPGTIPTAATRLAEASVLLQSLRHHVYGLAAEFDALASPDALETMAWALRFNNLKVAASEAAPQIVHKALQITGIQGYKNHGPYSVGRHLRDTLSAALMIGNDRIAAKSASMLLLLKEE
jgi:acyl-CoA dehydrogenase